METNEQRGETRENRNIRKRKGRDTRGAGEGLALLEGWVGPTQ